MAREPVNDRPESDVLAGDGAERLRRLQREFAAHIRDPERHPPPQGVEDRRMAVYRRLFFNNISSLLAGNFPVLRSLYDGQGWQRLVREFYAEYRCRTPLFTEIAKEFLHHLEGRGTRAEDPPFMLELSHYEWVELALSLDERELGAVAADPDGDLLSGCPVLSPLAWPLSYSYPVHLIQPDFQPTEPPVEKTHLLVYRNRQDTVRFMRMNEVTRFLLQQLRDRPERSGEDQLRAVAEVLGHPDPQRIVDSGAGVLEDLRQRDVLLGTRPTHGAAGARREARRLY